MKGSTELLFRNLLAFEQCHCAKNYIIDYVILINRLANTAEDVELLVQNGIVENWLWNTEECPFFSITLSKRHLLMSIISIYLVLLKSWMGTAVIGGTDGGQPTFSSGGQPWNKVTSILLGPSFLLWQLLFSLYSILYKQCVLFYHCRFCQIVVYRVSSASVSVTFCFDDIVSFM